MHKFAGFARTRELSWRWTALLFLAFSLGAWAIWNFAMPYFRHSNALMQFGAHRRVGLFAHIVPAGIALLIGPTQFWMGWTGHYVRLHRRLGKIYVISVALACITAVYLVATTQRPFIFALGLGALTLGWGLTTALAYRAILRRKFRRHWEWMVRSYIFTFVFVTFRLLVMLMKGLRLGTSNSRLIIAIWLCWIGPLLIAEVIMRRRKARKTFAAGMPDDLTSGQRPEHLTSPT